MINFTLFFSTLFSLLSFNKFVYPNNKLNSTNLLSSPHLSTPSLSSLFLPNPNLSNPFLYTPTHFTISPPFFFTLFIPFLLLKSFVNEGSPRIKEKHQE